MTKKLKECDYFSFRISFKYFQILLSAINKCHSMNIIHRDLKLSNIFLTNTFQLKIGDFGLSSIVNNNENSQLNEDIYNVGTPYYRSPELLEHNGNADLNDIKVLKSCDVFSLSIIFWQMINGIKYMPFKLFNKYDINHSNYKYIKYHNYDNIDSNLVNAFSSITKC